MNAPDGLAGRRILVVEDEFFLATDIVGNLEAISAEVIGPASDIDHALDLIDETKNLDAAVLDLNLQGEMAFPVADALIERGVPFVFCTGYDAFVIPKRYAAVPRCEKPVNPAWLSTALFA